MERQIVETLEDLGFYFIYSEGDDLLFFEWEDRSRLTDRDLKDIEYALSDILGRYEYRVSRAEANTFVVETFLT